MLIKQIAFMFIQTVQLPGWAIEAGAPIPGEKGGIRTDPR
jgi:hypothetical protein